MLRVNGLLMIIASCAAWPLPTGHLLSTMVGVEITLSKFAGTERPMEIFPAQPLSLGIFSRKVDAVVKIIPMELPRYLLPFAVFAHCTMRNNVPCYIRGHYIRENIFLWFKKIDIFNYVYFFFIFYSCIFNFFIKFHITFRCNVLLSKTWYDDFN